MTDPQPQLSRHREAGSKRQTGRELVVAAGTLKRYRQAMIHFCAALDIVPTSKREVDKAISIQNI